MKYVLNFTIAFFLFTSISNGQFNARFDAFLEETMIFLKEEVNPIGLSISIRSGDKVWSDAIGISAVDEQLTTSSIFAMGSITKTFISAAILKLMEENKLTLNDPLHLYLPNFDNIDSTITIKELLNHTSGIHDFSFHPEFFTTMGIDSNQFYRYSPEEVIEKFVLEKKFNKGTKQEYSNTNYTLLGMIITEIANQPFYKEIFEIFNISQDYPSISYPPFNSDVNELANLWSDVGNGLENIQASGFGLDGLFSSVGAAGAFVCTAADLSKWGYELYAGNLLSERSMDSLFDYHPLLLGGQREHGLGVFNITMECELNAVGHDGAIFYGSDLAYSEELDLSVAIMTNDNSEDGFSEIGSHLKIKEEIFCAYKESLTTSSEHIIDHLKVDIYPNPVHDIVSISLPETFDQSVQIEIYNEIGALVYSLKLQNNKQKTFQLDYFSKLSTGFYFIKIFDNENIFSEKLIKI